MTFYLQKKTSLKKKTFNSYFLTGKKNSMQKVK